jgi:hypothetical protein
MHQGAASEGGWRFSAKQNVRNVATVFDDNDDLSTSTGA